MGTAEESDAPTNELEALVTDLSASGPVVFVFGNCWLTTHLVGSTRPLFRGTSERRWWHVEHGDPRSKWVLDVRLDQIERVRFLRESSPFPSFPGEESLVIRFEAEGDQTALHCFLGALYEGRRLKTERLSAWDELRSRYGDRDESLVLHGSLQPVAAGV
jgi:putative heme iron utilization protein